MLILLTIAIYVVPSVNLLSLEKTQLDFSICTWATKTSRWQVQSNGKGLSIIDVCKCSETPKELRTPK